MNFLDFLKICGMTLIGAVTIAISLVVIRAAMNAKFDKKED